MNGLQRLEVKSYRFYFVCCECGAMSPTETTEAEARHQATEWGALDGDSWTCDDCFTRLPKGDPRRVRLIRQALGEVKP